MNGTSVLFHPTVADYFDSDLARGFDDDAQSGIFLNAAGEGGCARARNWTPETSNN